MFIQERGYVHLLKKLSEVVEMEWRYVYHLSRFCRPALDVSLTVFPPSPRTSPIQGGAT